MITSIIAAIGIALDAEFGTGYKIYPEEVKQGLQEPCFFIQCIQQTHDLFLGMYQGKMRYKRTHSFCIQYFPKDKLNAREEIHDTAERMDECLEWITVSGDLVRGTSMHHEINDDILSFFVSYDMFVITNVETTEMEEYSLNTEITAEGD